MANDVGQLSFDRHCLQGDKCVLRSLGQISHFLSTPLPHPLPCTVKIVRQSIVVKCKLRFLLIQQVEQRMLNCSIELVMYAFRPPFLFSVDCGNGEKIGGSTSRNRGGKSLKLRFPFKPGF